MRAAFTIISLFSLAAIGLSFSGTDAGKNLRRVYSRPALHWPSPHVDTTVKWIELGVLPLPVTATTDSSAAVIALGKVLFFDNRLSGGGKISCATCHQPALSWTDGRVRSEGHEGRLNKRNAPTLQNVWFYKNLFWDGRSPDLEDQAFAPINSETEMHQEMQELPYKLRKIPGYSALFKEAFGDAGIDPDRITGALAAFQRTITGRKSRFDEFLEGKTDRLTRSELRGLHLFRTKARCMNCHHGPLFSDNEFHNNGMSNDDPGRYTVTRKESDEGRMKTPSLRDVTFTGPWMHDGAMNSLDSIIDHYNNGAKGKNKDELLRPLHLNRKEKQDIINFLQSISSEPLPVQLPVLPR